MSRSSDSSATLTGRPGISMTTVITPGRSCSMRRFWKVFKVVLSLRITQLGLYPDSRSLTAADAERGEATPLSPFAQRPQQRDHQPHSRGAHGMPQGDRAAVDVQPLGVDRAERLRVAQRLLREFRRGEG